jgi:hypothetical protein
MKKRIGNWENDIVTDIVEEPTKRQIENARRRMNMKTEKSFRNASVENSWDDAEVYEIDARRIQCEMK